MPIVWEPPASAPVTVVSSDGRLEATTHSWPGVFLVGDFSDVAGVDRVVFERVHVDGSVHRVRSGDPALAPGGVGVAYDAEVPLGVEVSYRVTGGAVVSAPALVTVPGASDSSVGYIKALGSLSLSLAVLFRSVPSLARSRPVARFQVEGRENPVTEYGVASGRAGTLSFYSEDRAAVVALFAGSSRFLVDFPARFGLEPMFFDVETWFPVHLGDSDTTGVQFDIPVVEVDRPPTENAPLVIPGWDWADLAGTHADWAETKTAYTDWVELLRSGVN